MREMQSIRRFAIVGALVSLSQVVAQVITSDAVPTVSIKTCEGTGETMEELYMTMGYYADETCTTLITRARYHSVAGTCPQFQPGDFVCFPNIMNGGPNIYGKVLEAVSPVAQLDVVEDQQCAYDQQPAAVVATFNANRDSCVRLFGLTGGEGVIIWPAGGSGIAKRHENVQDTSISSVSSDRILRAGQQDEGAHKDEVRIEDDARCSGFDVAKSELITTSTIQISDVVNCRNSGSPCEISHSSQHETSIKSSFNLSAGISIGFFDVQAEFGFEYANTLTTSIQETVSVPINQQGYLTTYSKATRFIGSFSGCDDQLGPDTSGEIIALHNNGLTYQVVLTNG